MRSADMILVSVDDHVVEPADMFRQHLPVQYRGQAPRVVHRSDDTDVWLWGGRQIPNTITWECDYPHSDTTWPHAPERLAESLDGVPDEEVHQITWENASRHFCFDPFAHRPREECTTAALRSLALDVDLSLHSTGGKPPAEEPDQPVTARDITQQLATALQTPAE